MTQSAENDAGRATVTEAIAAWEAKGPTSLTVALMAEALYDARDRLGEPRVRLNGYITRPELWALDEACKPLRATFPDYGPHLVGSVMERPTFRDVDVRLILSDEQYDRLSDDEWRLLGFVTSRHLATVTGLPIDFQFQRQTEASAAYGHKFRTPLGMRGEQYWNGDQRPEGSGS